VPKEVSETNFEVEIEILSFTDGFQPVLLVYQLDKENEITFEEAKEMKFPTFTENSAKYGGDLAEAVKNPKSF
jgi:hypothetical protein